MTVEAPAGATALPAQAVPAAAREEAARAAAPTAVAAGSLKTEARLAASTAYAAGAPRQPVDPARASVPTVPAWQLAAQSDDATPSPPNGSGAPAAAPPDAQDQRPPGDGETPTSPNGSAAPATPDVHDRRPPAVLASKPAAGSPKPPDPSDALKRLLAPIVEAGDKKAERDAAAERAAKQLPEVVRVAGPGPRLASALERLTRGEAEALVDAWNAVSPGHAAGVFPAFANAVGQLGASEKRQYLSNWLTYACGNIENFPSVSGDAEATAAIDLAIRDLSAPDAQKSSQPAVLASKPAAGSPNPPDLKWLLAPIVEARSDDERSTAVPNVAKQLPYVVWAAGSGLASALKRLTPDEEDALGDAWTEVVSLEDAKTVFQAFERAIGQLDDSDQRKRLSEKLAYARSIARPAPNAQKLSRPAVLAAKPAAAPPKPPDPSGALLRLLALILTARSDDERSKEVINAARELPAVVRAAGPGLASALKPLTREQVQVLQEAWGAVSPEDAAAVFPAFVKAVGQLDDADKKLLLSWRLTDLCGKIKDLPAVRENPTAKAAIDQAILDLSARYLEARLRAGVLGNPQDSPGAKADKLAEIVRTKGITPEALGLALGRATKDGVGGLSDALKALPRADVEVVALSLVEAFVFTPYSDKESYAALTNALVGGFGFHAGKSPVADSVSRQILIYGLGLAAARQPEAHPSSATSR